MQTDNPLTDDVVLQFYREVHRDERRVPTIREVAKQFRHRSTTSVQRIVARLVESGQLARDGHRYRLSKSQFLQRGLPLVGRIAAGNPTEAIESDDYINLGEAYDPDQHFGLIVKGDSMIDVHIVDGDIAVLRRQATCNDGDIVAAIIDGEATLKRFFRQEDHILLKPENAEFKPLKVRDVEIRGVLVGVLRRY